MEMKNAGGIVAEKKKNGPLEEESGSWMKKQFKSL